MPRQTKKLQQNNKATGKQKLIHQKKKSHSIISKLQQNEKAVAKQKKQDKTKKLRQNGKSGDKKSTC